MCSRERWRFAPVSTSTRSSAGGAVIVPGGTAHTFWNPRPDPARYLLIMGADTFALIQAIHATDDRSPARMRQLERRRRRHAPGLNPDQSACPEDPVPRTPQHRAQDFLGVQRSPGRRWPAKLTIYCWSTRRPRREDSGPATACGPLRRDPRTRPEPDERGKRQRLRRQHRVHRRSREPLATRRSRCTRSALLNCAGSPVTCWPLPRLCAGIPSRRRQECQAGIRWAPPASSRRSCPRGTWRRQAGASRIARRSRPGLDTNSHHHLR